MRGAINDTLPIGINLGGQPETANAAGAFKYVTGLLSSASITCITLPYLTALLYYRTSATCVALAEVLHTVSHDRLPRMLQAD